MADIASPEEYAPKGSFLAGERILDDNPNDAPVIPANNPGLSAGLASRASQLRTDMGLPEEDISSLSKLEHRQLGERVQTEGVANEHINIDRQRMVQAYNAEGIGPNDLRPLDLNNLERQYRHSPVEAFGSLGSVFAMVASAFTHQPMTNALNAGAAALNAIKAGDEKEIDRHIDEWKENTTLALKRQAIQHEMYTDSVSLANTDMRSAEAKLRMQAARFGDEKLLLMLDRYGYSKEVVDMLTARNNQATSMAIASEQINKATLQNQIVKNDPDINSGDPVRMERGFNRIYGKEPTPEQQAVRQLYDDHIAQNLPPPTPEDIAQLHQKFQRIYGSGVQGTGPAAQAARMAKEWSEDPNNPHYGDYDGALFEANQKLAQSKQVVTANKAAEIKSHIAQYDNALQLIDKVENTLNTYAGSAGLAGKATRVLERISDVLQKSGPTERVQLMRNISELQLLAPRLLLDSRGRPLSAEAGHISDIIAGLSTGDTVANTLRAYKEVKQQLKTLQQSNREILMNQSPTKSGSSTGEQGVDAETSKDTGAWWLAAPKVNQ